MSGIGTLSVFASQNNTDSVISLSNNTTASFEEETNLLREQPSLQVDDSGVDGVEMEFMFPHISTTTTIIKGKEYQHINIDGFGKLSVVGKPALPVRIYMLAVPTGASAQIELLDSLSELIENYLVHPAQNPQFDHRKTDETEFVIDEEFYGTNQNYPLNPISITANYKIRGINVIKVQVCPVQYNPVSGQLTVYSQLKFKVSFKGENKQSLNTSEHSPQFIKLLRNVVINSKVFMAGDNDFSSSGDSDESIIIVTHSDYIDAATALADWKKQSGFSVEVISQSSWTSREVETAIRDRYEDLSPKPGYFIIVGDHEDVPAREMYFDGSSTYVTDLYYACTDGHGDYYPDMAYGRISVSSAIEADTVIDKIIQYQRTPPADEDFYRHGLAAAYFEDDNRDTYADKRFAQTSEEIVQHLTNEYGYEMSRVFYAEYPEEVLYWNDSYFGDGEPVPDYLRYPNFSWDGDRTDIKNQINEGRIIVTHRDHGDTSSWIDPEFDIDDILELNNGDKLPVVFSINCDTGEFDLTCFCETFLRHAAGGAVGIIGASSSGMSGYNDCLAEGLIDAIWPELVPQFPHNDPDVTEHEPIYRMGDVLNQGKIRMEETWKDSRYTFEIFHYFGDPTMEIWTSVPQTIIVNHVDEIEYGETTLHLSDASCQTGIGTLYCNGEIIGRAVLESGSATIPVDSPSATEETALLTISSHGYRPYQSEIVMQGISTPSLTTNEATNVTESSATGHGAINSTGGQNCDRRGFCWNISSGPDINDSSIEETGSFGTGNFSSSLIGLIPNTKYYVRTYAHNDAGYSYGNEISFTTKPEAPVDFDATTVNSTRIKLSWIKGAGAQKTKIQRKIGSYPVHRDDGTTIYFNTGNNITDIGLVPENAYYYRSWSWIEDGDVWSNYSQDSTGTFSRYDIDLTTGWNLMSLPLVPDDTAIEDILNPTNLASGNSTNISLVYSFNSSSDSWIWWDGTAASTLSNMEDGSSYWINAVEADTLTVHGTEAGQIGPSYPVHSDWNMIGFSSTGDITPEKYLNSVIADCSLLYCWLEGGWSWWMKENPGSTLSTMKPGSGYWLNMNAAGTITPT